MIRPIKAPLFSILILLFTAGTQLQATPISWLPPPASKTPVISPQTDQFLRELGGSLRVLYCGYEGAALSEQIPFDKTGVHTPSGNWACTVNTQSVKGEADALDVTVKVTLKTGSAESSGVAVAFDFTCWNENQYVMIPASVYNGNRNRIVAREYGTGLDRSDLYRKDLPLTTNALPQLAYLAGEPSKIEVNAANATTPAISFYDRKTRRAFILLAEQGIPTADGFRDNGFIIEENNARTHATLVVNAPGVRSRKPEFVGFGPSPDSGISWKAGDSVTLRFRLYAFDAPAVSGLLDRFMSVRKVVTGPNQPRNLLPLSQTLRLMSRNIDDRFYEGSAGRFYCPENANWISFGWIGGLMNTFPMLALGDSLHRERVASTFDFAIPRGQGPSGYFYGALNADGTVFGREGYDEFPEIVLTRKNADVLYWMIKQFNVLKAQGHAETIRPDWEKNIKRLADAFIATWKQHGQWGNFVNNATGAVAVYNTTGGAMAIAGLALAAAYYEEPVYLEVAKNAARYYYTEDFLKTGMTTGACADILQNADSETAIALTTSLMTLYEETGEDEWLRKCSDLANLTATWTVSYDYLLPPQTPLGHLGARLTGVVWASTQNKHGAPGFCTSSGDALFKLYRATADRRYAELTRDIVHAHAEGIQPDGHITERLTYCDADSRGSRGDGGKTGWNETNGALMALELPGIYIRTDKNEWVVFDHVTVKQLEASPTSIKLEITNPTPYDASVSLLAESAAEAQKPIGCTGFLRWPKIELKAGETIVYSVKK